MYSAGGSNTRRSARGARAAEPVPCHRGADRGQGFRYPADPGADCRWLPRRHPLPAGMRKDHAAACADRDDRERLRPYPRNRTLARRIPPRDDGLPEGQARRSGRFNCPVPRLVQETDAELGHLRAHPPKGRKIEATGAGLCPPKAPPGIGAVQTFSGRRIIIAEDRIVEMSEEDADCLIPDGWIKLTEWNTGGAG